MWLSAGCKADLPNQVASDAGVVVACTVYADKLVAFNPADSEGGSELGVKALGPPDSDGVSLTTNAVLTVAFLGLGGIIDQTGDDLLIHSTLGAGAEVAVYVGFGEGDKEFSGSLTASDGQIDISTAGARIVSYVELVSISGETTVDAFESLRTVCE